MRTPPPLIGMDRFIDAEWMDLAAAVVRGEIKGELLRARLAADISSTQVQRKTAGIINRMWFPDEQAARDLVSIAARLVLTGSGDRIAAFEAVAIASYPYFRHVLETVGRLLRLQETCSAGEVHRRMFEQYGKRTTIDQATSYTFKTMVSWKMIERRANRNLGLLPPVVVTPPGRSLLDLAANRSRSSVSPLRKSDPLLFPFCR